MRYISLFSGIEAASVAWEDLGWTPICFSEIEAFPRAVLAYHWPEVPLHGDMTQVDWSAYRGQADVVVAGAPCQAFSVAGLRQSLDDHRGNLTLATLEAVDAIDPAYFVFENVPGILSTRDNAFGCFLAGLAGADAPLVSPLKRGRWTNAGVVAGPRRTVAWRILDAQYFGVPQRRRRVFVIGCPRNGADPTQILFECQRLPGHPAPRRKAGEEVAGSLGGGSGSRGWSSDTERMTFVPDLSYAINAHPSRRIDGESETFVVNARQTPVHTSGKDLPLGAKDKGHAFISNYEYPKGNQHGEKVKDRPAKILSFLWEVAKKEEATLWGLGVLFSLLEKEILQYPLFWEIHYQTAFSGNPVQRQKNGTESEEAGKLRSVWAAGCERRSPPRWRLSKQRKGELTAYMSWLPQQDASLQRFLCDMWTPDEGARILQQTLYKIQEIWQSISIQDPAQEEVLDMRRICTRLQSVREALYGSQKERRTIKERSLGVMAVRRLTPL